MATVRHQIAEHDVVELRKAVDAWPAGTSGNYGDTKPVEISDDSGATLDLSQGPLSKLDVNWRAAQH